MGNVLKIVRRDALRLLRVPAAWVILIGLVAIPPLYAWINTIGFWDPYGNTKNIPVAVANEDAGTTSELVGTVNFGKEIETTLRSNDNLGWRFVDEDEALRQVKSAESYAAIVIPKDFSARLVAAATGGERPTLNYYVNEKANGVATKISDTGANTVDRQINSTFVSTVSSVVSSTLNSTASGLSAKLSDAHNQTVKDLNTVQATLNNTRSNIASLDASLAQVPDSTQRARGTVNTLRGIAQQSGNTLSDTATLISQTQTGLNSFIGSASTSLDKGAALLSQASSSTNLLASSVAASLTEANGNVASTLNVAQQVNADAANLISTLQAMNLPGSNDLISKLSEQNATLTDATSHLQQLNTDVGNTVTSAAATANSINTATQQTLQTTGNARSSLISGTLPSLNTGLTGLSTASASLGAGISSQSTTLDQVSTVLDQLDQAASSARQALSNTDAGLAQLQTKLDTLSTDLTALADANLLKELFGIDGNLDTEAIAKFMLSPTVIDTHTLYSINAYGSSMAPLFINLSLWAGAFMLMVMFKLETDDEGIEDLTPGQRYWGRWLLLAIIAMVQGLVTTVGELIIGVQTVNTLMFILTGMLVSLVYLSIAFAMSTSFLHVGKGLIMALIIVQVPGASGLYPIEIMPRFFRALYPFFPFTYSIKAFRETIGGFYGNHWLNSMGVLLLFAVVFFFLGLVIRPYLTNLNRLFAREIKEGDMIAYEPMQMPGREFRISQAIAMLANKDEYREAIERKAAEFEHRYPQLKRAAFIAGLVVPAVLAITFSLTTGTMLIALAAWFVWFFVIVTVLMTLEMTRDSIERQVRLGTLSDESIREILSKEYKSSSKRKRNIYRAGNAKHSASPSRDIAELANEFAGTERHQANLALLAATATAQNRQPTEEAKNNSSADTQELPASGIKPTVTPAPTDIRTNTTQQTATDTGEDE